MDMTWKFTSKYSQIQVYHWSWISTRQLDWELVSTDVQWALTLWARVANNHHFTWAHITSSLWYGIKQNINTLFHNSLGLLRNGSKNFWCTKWLNEPIASLLSICLKERSLLKAKVIDFWKDGVWDLPKYCGFH